MLRFEQNLSFVNSQQKNTNSKGDLYLKTLFKSSFQRFLVYKNQSDSDLVWQIQLISIKSSKHTQYEFLTFNNN